MRTPAEEEVLHRIPVQYSKVKSPGLKSDILGENYPHGCGNLSLHRISCAVTLNYNSMWGSRLQGFFREMPPNLHFL